MVLLLPWHTDRFDFQLSRVITKNYSTAGYPWVSWGGYVTQEPRFRDLLLDHQLLKELEPKNRSKTAKFDQKSSLWVVF